MDNMDEMDINMDEMEAFFLPHNLYICNNLKTRNNKPYIINTLSSVIEWFIVKYNSFEIDRIIQTVA